MKIRRYQSEDNVKHLIREAVEDTEPQHYSQGQQKHLEDVIPEMNIEFAEKERYIYYVAEESGEIIGVAGFQKESGTVAGIFVDPIKQSDGTGSRLMNKIEEKAREENLEKMETLASLEAVKFYKKNGYKITDERDQEIEGKDIEIKVMVKNLLG